MNDEENIDEQVGMVFILDKTKEFSDQSQPWVK
jgi:hypothetical protein